jgi:hypothetical protein
MENSSKSTKWAEEFIISLGYIITNLPQDVQTTPWSTIKRFLTSDGYFYLKQTPPALSLEPDIIQILRDQFHANVPILIGSNKDLNCFLVKDSGNPLRDFFKQNFQPELLCQAITIYSKIQRAVADHINTFLELGVPDWRLDKLPILYMQLISEVDLLKEDGLKQNEIDILHKLIPKFSLMCEQLSHYKIPQTLDHCDFHDNNILLEINTHQLTIIDWCESVITHPFFSFITCLRNATYGHAIKETDKIYLELQDACLEIWLGFESKNNLLEAISLAKQIWPIYESLGQYRLMTSCNAEEFKSLNRRGRLMRGFKDILTNNMK